MFCSHVITGIGLRRAVGAFVKNVTASLLLPLAFLLARKLAYCSSLCPQLNASGLRYGWKHSSCKRFWTPFFRGNTSFCPTTSLTLVSDTFFLLCTELLSWLTLALMQLADVVGVIPDCPMLHNSQRCFYANKSYLATVCSQSCCIIRRYNETYSPVSHLLNRLSQKWSWKASCYRLSVHNVYHEHRPLQSLLCLTDSGIMTWACSFI